MGSCWTGAGKQARRARYKDLPHTQFVPLAFGWVPKENMVSRSAFLNTAREVYISHNISVDPLCIVLDGTPAGAAAVHRLFPDISLVRDLRRILQGVRELKLAICRERRWADHLAAEVAWRAALATDTLFSLVCLVAE